MNGWIATTQGSSAVSATGRGSEAPTLTAVDEDRAERDLSVREEREVPLGSVERLEMVIPAGRKRVQRDGHLNQRQRRSSRWNSKLRIVIHQITTLFQTISSGLKAPPPLDYRSGRCQFHLGLLQAFQDVDGRPRISGTAEYRRICLRI